MRKIILLLLLLFMVGVAGAQTLEGVYLGEIFSVKNTFILSTTGPTAIGTIYLNGDDKLIFVGSVDNFKLLGMVQKGKEQWQVVGELIGDSLFLSLNFATTKRVSRLFKISNSAGYDTNRLAKEGFQNDKSLIGEWIHSKAIKADGTERKASAIESGMKYIFTPNGLFSMRSPYVDRFIKSQKRSAISYRWQTKGAKLIRTGIDNTKGQPVYLECAYEVRGDTLVLEYMGNKDLFVLRKSGLAK